MVPDSDLSDSEPIATLQDLVRQGLEHTGVDFAKSARTAADPQRSLVFAEAPSSVALAPARRAAAVLASFDPRDLRDLATSDGPEDGGLYDVLAESTPLDGTGQTGRWMLGEDARRKTLQALVASGGVAAIRSALDEVPNEARPDTPSQRAFERLLARPLLAPAPLDADRVPLSELDGMLQAARWLHGIVPGVPAPEAVREWIAYRDLLAPFERLVGDHFRGRQPELDRLGDYVGVQAASSVLQSLGRLVREVFDLREAPPLLVHGPGGSGKSTLIARFVLDHARLARSERFPFVYLDFDRPGLSAEQPATLLVEAVRQLTAQYPEHAERLRQTQRDWHRELRRQTGIKTRGGGPMWNVIPDFAAVLGDLGIGDQPLLFVLDTFEEVQHRGGHLVENLGFFLMEMQQAWPRLRTVLAGRSPIGRFPFRVETLPLNELDPEAARGYLEAHGIPPEDARPLARRLGGDPLTLALATKTWALAGREGLAGIDRTRRVFARLRADQIQGQLYERILAHVPDPAVRKLAHPGLVLRRLTPEIVLAVLDEPCGLGLRTRDRAKDLFERLRRDATLVVEEPGGALRHRPDVRRVMIRNLTVDAPELVEAIHRRAVAYYERVGQTPVERAEEVYHRLALGQPPEEVDPRWMRGVEAFFSADTVEELGAPARVYLASRVPTLTVGEDLRAQADLVTWERLVASEVADLVQAERLSAASDRLREREARSPGSPLLRYDVEVPLRLGALDEANRASVDGLLLTGDDIRLSADLLLLQARIALLMGAPERAALVLTDAADVAATLRDPVRAFAADLYRLGLSPAPTPETLNALADRYAALPTERLRERRALAYQAAADLATVLPEEDDLPSRVGRTLATTIQAVGFEMATESERSNIAEALAAWDRRISKQTGRPGDLARALGSSAHTEGGFLQAWRDVTHLLSRERIGEVLENVQALGGLDSRVAERVRRVYAAALEDLNQASRDDGLALV